MENKLRTIKILQILKDNSDEFNILSIKDINDALYNDGYKTYDRKTIYSDIKALNEIGFQIEIVRKDQSVGYYYANDTFQKAELRILVDLLVSCDFVTEKKTKEMIEKLLSQTNKATSKKIKNTLDYLHHKSINEKIYYNVDTIQTALEEEKAITFSYYDLNELGEKNYRKHDYLVIPYGLVINDGKYYCIVYTEKYKEFINYRVDKMEKIELVETKHKRLPFDINKQMSSMFNMYVGDKQEVQFECKKGMNMSILDRFTDNMTIIKSNDDSFIVSALISVSLAFYGWCFQSSNVIKLIGSQKIVDEYKDYLKNELERYK